MKWVFSLMIALWAYPADAKCSGQDIRPGLSPEIRAEIADRVAHVPFAKGNHWRATRGGETVHLIGTIHMDDPRMDALTARLAGVIETSDLVLFEMTPAENAKLQDAMATQPDLLFMKDTTLPELLDETDWQRVMDALRARNIPPVIASRFQPWYVSILLAMPPCLSQSLQRKDTGLDHRLMAIAQNANVPIRALEPWDTLFSIFADDPMDEQIGSMIVGLDIAASAEDALATLREAYFEERHAQAWEISRWAALQSTYLPKDENTRLFDAMQADLLTRRNANWIDVILDAAKGRSRITVAFGAAHLGGDDGVLALLQAKGFSIERLPF